MNIHPAILNYSTKEIGPVEQARKAFDTAAQQDLTKNTKDRKYLSMSEEELSSIIPVCRANIGVLPLNDPRREDFRGMEKRLARLRGESVSHRISQSKRTFNPSSY